MLCTVFSNVKIMSLWEQIINFTKPYRVSWLIDRKIIGKILLELCLQMENVEKNEKVAGS